MKDRKNLLDMLLKEAADCALLASVASNPLTRASLADLAQYYQRKAKELEENMAWQSQFDEE